MMMLDNVVICVVEGDVFCSEHGSCFKKFLKTGLCVFFFFFFVWAGGGGH